MSSDPSRTPEENTDSPPPSSAAASRCEWACSHQQEMTSHSPPSPFACVCTDYFAGFSLNQPLLAPPVNLKDSENPPSSLRGERGEAAALLLKCRSIPGGAGGVRRASHHHNIAAASFLHPRRSREAETHSMFACASVISRPGRK